MVQPESPPEELVLGNLQVDLRTYGASVRGIQIDLTFNEFELLTLLCREANRILTYEAICKSLWDSYGSVERRRLSVTIFRLRAKLEGSWPYQVETVRGRGYGFIYQRGPAQV